VTHFSLDVTLNASIIKTKEKFQFIKIKIFERKSPTVLDSVVDLIDVNSSEFREVSQGARAPPPPFGRNLLFNVSRTQDFRPKIP
jgi:hypothetical protein